MAANASGVPDVVEDISNITGVTSVIVLDNAAGRESARLNLVCVAGTDTGRQFRIGAEPLVIGRGSVEIELTGTDVSRRHACISYGPDGYTLEDLESVNGTYLNGARVVGRVPLHAGDRVQVGTTVLVFAQRDELEERMQRVQRLESMGALAGGLAHDFNNTLAVIVANLDFVEESLPADATEGREALEAMRKAALSGAALAKRLLRLGSTDPLTFALVPLSSLVEQTVVLARRQVGPKIQIPVSVEQDLCVLGSYEELHQVLINLLINARDAMGETGGKVGVKARRVTLDAAEAVQRDLAQAGEYCEITVTDNGSGMDEATLARAFEPFFTTKPRGKGTGLGLAMIHGCVRRHGGAIEVASKVGHGTMFRLLFHATPKK
ncbi:MAG TPA: ATP-binding protein [Kofleriaceae bacterium]|jgi:signal transduction histidine kinase